nr:MAG TPA: hypothetical protein [Caudoviricetes sp.]DAK59213.1 MAG TPA: hypothetical protein [Caudoviricetes sp.]
MKLKKHLIILLIKRHSMLIVYDFWERMKYSAPFSFWPI